MRSIGFLLLHLAILVLKVLRSGGTKTVIAENLILRHQLSVLNRSNRRAPNLKPSDRVTLGLFSLLVKPARLKSVAIVVQPATLLKFHRALVRRKYQRLFSAKSHRKPGPKGPSKELIDAIVAIKQRRLDTVFNFKLFFH